MATQNTSSGGSRSGGIGFFGLLTVVFVTLKLTGHIDWTWWWVFSPLFIAATLWLLLLFVVAALTVYLEK